VVVTPRPPAPPHTRGPAAANAGTEDRMGCPMPRPPRPDQLVFTQTLCAAGPERLPASPPRSTAPAARRPITPPMLRTHIQPTIRVVMTQPHGSRGWMNCPHRQHRAEPASPNEQPAGGAAHAQPHNHAQPQSASPLARSDSQTLNHRLAGRAPHRRQPTNSPRPTRPSLSQIAQSTTRLQCRLKTDASPPPENNITDPSQSP
jgi:hypothetical protein